MLAFSLEATSERARAGQLRTAHGDVATPAFMPVGTAATVKAMLPESVRQTGADMVLANTYHLMQRPGLEVIHALGGLHNMMGWNRPILTDSGGYQVMSLAALAKVTDHGVRFRSHVDGQSIDLTPERAMQVQHRLGSTISMVLDQCIAWPASFAQAQEAMERSTLWARRSLNAYQQRQGYGVFAIVQGGLYQDLRQRSVGDLRELDVDGFAIGGLAVGETQALMLEIVSYVTQLLPTTKPRYLMGVGKPDDIINAVAAGVDLFDCVLPTRSGRNGQAFTAHGAVNLRNARFRLSDAPLEPNCDCPACQHFTCGYLRHLHVSGEILGAMLLTWHNIAFYQRLMRTLRHAIISDAFASVCKELRGAYGRNSGCQDG